MTNLIKGGEIVVQGSGIGKVVIATPSLDGNLCLEYQVSLMRTCGLLQTFAAQVDVAFLRGDCFIDKARNNLVNQFLSRNGDHLFFVDADQGWDEKAFVRMVLDPHEIVAAAVPKKQDEICFNNVDLITNDNKDCVIDNGLLKVNHIGTGFMRIKRSAIDKMLQAYPEKYVPGDGSEVGEHYSLFERKIIDGHFWGEDLVFCKKWTAIGGTIWVDPNVDIEHIGRKSWKGNFLQFLQKNCKVDVFYPKNTDLKLVA